MHDVTHSATQAKVENPVIPLISPPQVTCLRQEGRTLVLYVMYNDHILNSEVEAFVGDAKCRGRITYVAMGFYVIWLERVEDGLWAWETARWSTEATDPRPGEILVRAMKGEHDEGDPVLPACEIPLFWGE